MGDIVQLNSKKAKTDRQQELLHFMGQLDLLKELYITGRINKIFIIAEGEAGKCCTGNKITLKTAKQLCNDFLSNHEEYMDK